MPEALAIPVHLGGLFAGRELSGEGVLHFDGDSLRIELGSSGAGGRPGDAPDPAVRRRYAPLHWTVSVLDGVRHRDGELTLFLGDGEVIELTGPPPLADVARAIEADARSLGEMTRGLRSLGARRRGSAAGSEQSRFFAPLLQARRMVEKARRARSADPLGAFDGEALRAALAAAIADLARERYPANPPERRALEAGLEECAEPLLGRMDALVDAANAVRRGPDDDRLVRWRAWAREVGAVFARADQCWCAMVPVLDAAPPPPPRRAWWRRALRLGDFPRRA